MSLEEIVTDDKKLSVIQKHGQLVVIIVLAIALVTVCMKFMAHMESDAADLNKRINNDQEVIKMWRDSQVQSNRMEKQTDKIDEIYKKLKDPENVQR